MLFNSFVFAVFLPLVFLLYWAIPRRSVRLKNLYLIVASYVFYGWWDWRFLSLIFVSSLTDYLVGLGFLRFRSLSARRSLLAISLTVNLGLLGFFKYFGFFVDSFVTLLGHFGLVGDPHVIAERKGGDCGGRETKGETQEGQGKKEGQGQEKVDRLSHIYCPVFGRSTYWCSFFLLSNVPKSLLDQPRRAFGQRFPLNDYIDSRCFL